LKLEKKVTTVGRQPSKNVKEVKIKMLEDAKKEFARKGKK
jgi:hypothetical protein